MKLITLTTILFFIIGIIMAGNIKTEKLVLGSARISKQYKFDKSFIENSMKNHYQNLVNCKSDVNEDANQFIMLDNSQWFLDKSNNFLK